MFLVNEEVEMKIRASAGYGADKDITVADIIRSVIQETWVDNRRSVRLWEAQGRRAAKAKELWAQAGIDLSTMTSGLAEKFVEDDAKTLKSRYHPTIDDDNEANEESTDPFIEKINDHCRTFGVNPLDYDDFGDDYEREQDKQREQQLAPEIEQESSTERPPPATPIIHKKHRDVTNFINTGRASPRIEGFKWAFEVFRNPELHKFIPEKTKSGGLLVTRDFGRSIAMATEDGFSDDYQKPVRWVLTGGPEKQPDLHMIVISAFEANVFMDQIKASPFVCLHIYAPRQNETFQPLDNLQLYTVTGRQTQVIVPDSLRTELNLFAGQLYFKNYKQYLDVHKFLNMAPPSWKNAPPGAEIKPDRFMEVIFEEAYQGPAPRFKTSPVKGMRHLMTCVRGDSRAIEKTHMGKLLDGKLLFQEELEERRKRSADEISKE